MFQSSVQQCQQPGQGTIQLNKVSRAAAHTVFNEVAGKGNEAALDNIVVIFCNK